jgi:hypothetical protein
MNQIRIWLCECRRVHVETPYCRLTYEPAAFIALLRQQAATHGTEAVARLGLACYEPTAFRAAQPPVRLIQRLQPEPCAYD